MGGAVEEILLERRHKWDSKVKKKMHRVNLKKKKKWLKKATAIYFLVYIVEINKS